MFERPKGGERAILIQLTLPDMDHEESLTEFHELATSAQAHVVATITGSRRIPDAKFFIGLGKAEEIRDLVKNLSADLVLINHELSPSQERNLEKIFNCRVVDRSGLILDIFAQRAHTFEGKLQVELAQLEHLSTRLIRGWTHLERQKGGIGLRGPGETQLETDRRLLRKRIKYIHQQLEKVRSNREQNRRARQKSGMPTVSLVGYTNAGKTSLFNALTKEKGFAADQLFATLDPTMRQLKLPGASPVILADTVGFIRHLPHQLIQAFQATLEETKEADLLLHVIDLSHPNWRELQHAVEQVLEEIGVTHSTPVIQVMNKIDTKPELSAKMNFDYSRVWISAYTGAGLDMLIEAIIAHLFGELIDEEITVPADQAKLRAALFSLDAVVSETIIPDGGGWRIKIRWSPPQKKRLQEQFNLH